MLLIEAAKLESDEVKKSMLQPKLYSARISTDNFRQRTSLFNNVMSFGERSKNRNAASNL